MCLTEMQPQDPANVVLIGLCSGAYLAVEGVLAFGARGACLLNPPVGSDLLHAAATFRRSRVKWLRSMAKLLMRVLHLRHPWASTGSWQVVRMFLPRRYSEDLIATAAKRNTTLLVLSSVDDLSPFPGIPFLRSIDRRRVAAPEELPRRIRSRSRPQHARREGPCAGGRLDRQICARSECECRRRERKSES